MDPESSKSHAQLAKTANNLRIISENLFNATIELNISSIIIVTKPGDSELIRKANSLINWLLNNYKDLVIYVDTHLQPHIRIDDLEGSSSDFKATLKRKESMSSRLFYWDQSFFLDPNFCNVFDLAITLGGDGTVLYVSQLFQQFVPPVIAFSLGSLGFLTNFKFKNYQKILTKVLRLKYVKINLRMRLSCQVVDFKTNTVKYNKNVLNEVTIDRGSNPFLTNLALYGNNSFVTVAQADGLCIATPTGSTAYSLAAGGSLVHSSVSAISVTPICPHTLSFRPIILPDSMELKVVIPSDSRCSTACLSFDGKSRLEMTKNDYLVISACEYSFPTVMNGGNEYFESVSKNLNWNSRKLQKPLYFNDFYDEEHSHSNDKKFDSVESLIDTIYSDDEEDSSSEEYGVASFLRDSDDDYIETPTIPFRDINEALEIFSDEERHSPVRHPLPPKSRSGSQGASSRFRTNSFTNFNQIYKEKIHLDKKINDKRELSQINLNHSGEIHHGVDKNGKVQEKPKISVRTGSVRKTSDPTSLKGSGSGNIDGTIKPQVITAPPKKGSTPDTVKIKPKSASDNKDDVSFQII